MRHTRLDHRAWLRLTDTDGEEPPREEAVRGHARQARVDAGGFDGTRSFQPWCWVIACSPQREHADELERLRDNHARELASARAGKNDLENQLALAQVRPRTPQHHRTPHRTPHRTAPRTAKESSDLAEARAYCVQRV